MTGNLAQQAGEAVGKLLQPYTDPQVVVLVLSPDRQSILEANLRPLSELTALLAAQQPIRQPDQPTN